MIEFGVMSCVYEMEGDAVGKEEMLAMCLFMEKNIPIAIYKPEETSPRAFMPIDFLKDLNANKTELNHDRVRKVYASIKKIRG